MPAKYRIDTERRVVFSTATGILSEDDITDHQARLRADPDFDGKLDQLWDFSGVTAVEVASATIRQLARARSFEAGVKRAVVAPSDVAFGMARMFQMLHEDAPEEMRVFRASAEARRWLGID